MVWPLEDGYYNNTGQRDERTFTFNSTKIFSPLVNVGIADGARDYTEDMDLVVGVQGKIMCKQMSREITSNLQ